MFYKDTLISSESVSDDLSELEYAKYEVRGSFDNSRELFIGPR